MKVGVGDGIVGECLNEVIYSFFGVNTSDK